jgi:hypothetical protein
VDVARMGGVKNVSRIWSENMKETDSIRVDERIIQTLISEK